MSGLVLPPVAPHDVKGSFGTRCYPDEERARLSRLLSQPVPKGEISERDGPGGRKVAYLKSSTVTRLANQIFTPMGWSESLRWIGETMCVGPGPWSVGCGAIIRIELEDGTYREDYGAGRGTDRDKSQAFANARKAAVSDARKRALKGFGDRLGNSISDKAYLREMSSRAGTPGSRAGTPAVPTASVAPRSAPVTRGTARPPSAATTPPLLTGAHARPPVISPSASSSETSTTPPWRAETARVGVGAPTMRGGMMSGPARPPGSAHMAAAGRGAFGRGGGGGGGRGRGRGGGPSGGPPGAVATGVGQKRQRLG
jgi:DNA repair and recombination protein RAD52